MYKGELPVYKGECNLNEKEFCYKVVSGQFSQIWVNYVWER